MTILENHSSGSQDLKEKSLMMSGILLEMASHSKRGQGYNNAKLILESGLALKKFEEIINRQGKNKISLDG